MVRNLPDIFASLEMLFRNNHHRSSPIIDNANMQGTTTPKRVDIWTNNPPLGLSLDRLSEVIRQGIDKKMLFIKYESLCLYPELELNRIYEYLELPPCTLNFDHIPQTTIEDDEVYGISGLHIIRPKLEMQQSKALSVLGQDVHNWIMSNFMWYHEYFGYKM
jgi:sulfotransferase